MEAKKKVAIIGVGNCGSQVAYLAERKYGSLFDCIYINTSEADLSQVSTTNGMKFKIGNGEKIKVEGSGKNRAKMKEYLEKDLESILNDAKLQEIISTKKYVFVVASAAGGTGSGAAPVLMTIMDEMFRNVNFKLVVVLPRLKASLMEHGNELEFMDELYNVMPESTSYMVYDNETTAGLPPTVALTKVNENIVEDIRIMTGIDNRPTPYESIDDADMENIVTTPGRTLVVRITSGITEKFMEDNKIDDLIIKAIKQSCNAETDRNKRVLRWGVITYFTEEVNKLYSSDLDGVAEFLGNPIERHNHNAINKSSEDLNYLYLIASGLSPINDRMQKVNDQVDKLKEELASDETSKYIMGGDGVSYNTIEERKKLDKKNNMKDEIDPNVIFNRFKKRNSTN